MINRTLSLLFCCVLLSANAQFAPLSNDLRYAHRDVFDLSCMIQSCTAKGNKPWFDQNGKPEFQNKEGIWQKLPELWETYSLYSKDKAIETINQLDKARFSEEERVWAALQLYLIDKNVPESEKQLEKLRKLNPDSYLLLFTEINNYLGDDIWSLENEKTQALLDRVDIALKSELLSANHRVFLQLAQFDLKTNLGQSPGNKEVFIDKLWKEHPGLLVPEMVGDMLSKEKKEYANTLFQIDMLEKDLSLKTIKLLRSPLLDYANPVELKELIGQAAPTEKVLIKTLAFIHVSKDAFAVSKSLLGDFGTKLMFPDGEEKRKFSAPFQKELAVQQSRDEWNALAAETTGTTTSMSDDEFQRLVKMGPKGLSTDEAAQLIYGLLLYFNSSSELFGQSVRFSFHGSGKQERPEEKDLASVDTFVAFLRANPYFDLREEIVFMDKLILGEETEGKTLFFSNPGELLAAIDQFKSLENEYPASPIIKNNLMAMIRYCTRLDTNYRTEAVIRAYAQTYIDLMCLSIQDVQPDSGFLVDDGVKMMGDENPRVFDYFSKAERKEFITRLKTIDSENENGDIAREMIEYLENYE